MSTREEQIGDDIDPTTVTPTGNPQQDAAAIARRLATHSEANIVDASGNQVYSYTNLVSPEWYNKHIKGREELVGWSKKDPYDANRADFKYEPGSNPAYTNFFQPPPLSDEQRIAMSTALIEHMDSLPLDDPETAFVYQTHPMLLFADAELAATQREALLSGLDTATRSGSFITGTATSAISFESMEDTLRLGENTSFWLDDYSKYFDKSEMDLIAYNFGLTDINRREALASRARANVVDNEIDLRTEAGRLSFLDWMSQEAHGLMNESREERGFWNRGFNKLDAAFGTMQAKDFVRRNLVPNLKRWLRGDETDWTPGNPGWETYFDLDNKYDPQYYQYTGSVPDPKNWAYEVGLTGGQQLAAGAGFAYDSAAYNVSSAIFDGFQYIASPGDILINVATGGTAVAGKVALVGMKDLTRLGRLRLAAKASIPVLGRRITTNGQLPRGIAQRVGWALNARTMDQMFDLADKRGVIQHMFDITKEHGSVGATVARYSHMAQVADSPLAEVLDNAALADDYELFRDALRIGTAGIADADIGSRINDLRSSAARLQTEINQEVDQLLDGVKAGDEISYDYLQAMQEKWSKGETIVRYNDGWRLTSDLTGDEMMEVTRGVQEGTAEIFFVDDINWVRYNGIYDQDHKAWLDAAIEHGTIHAIDLDDIPDVYKRTLTSVEEVAEEPLELTVPVRMEGWRLTATDASTMYDLGDEASTSTEMVESVWKITVPDASGGQRSPLYDTIELTGEGKYVIRARGDVPIDPSHTGLHTYDSLEEAFGAVIQAEYDTQLVEEIMTKPVNRLINISSILRTMTQDGSRELFIEEVVSGLFTGRMNDTIEAQKFAELLFDTLEENPWLLMMAADESFNSGSASTRTHNIINGLLDPTVDNSVVGVDNQTGGLKQMLIYLARAQEALTFDNLDELVAEGNFAAILVKAAQDAGLDFSEVSGTGIINGWLEDPDKFEALQQFFANMQPEMFDEWAQKGAKTHHLNFWSDIEHDAPGNPWDYTDAWSAEPFRFTGRMEGHGFYYGNWMDTVPLPFTNEQIERGLMRGPAFMQGRGFADDEIRVFGDGLLDYEGTKEWAENYARIMDALNEQWKRALHYKYKDNPNVRIPVFRGSSDDANNLRLSSWTTNWETAERFGSAFNWGYAPLSKAYMPGPMTIILGGAGRDLWMDTIPEVVIENRHIVNANEVGLRYRLGAQTPEADIRRALNDWLLGNNLEFTPEMDDAFLEATKDAVGERFLLWPNEEIVEGSQRRHFKLTMSEGKVTPDQAKRAEMTKLNMQANRLEKMNEVEAVVYDLPPINRRRGQTVSDRLLSKDEGWANGMRRTYSRATKIAMPESIDLTDPVHAMGDLKRTLRALGASEKLIMRELANFMQAAPEARADAVINAMKAVGDEHGNPLLTHLIDQAIRNGNARRNSLGVDANGFPSDIGQTAEGFLAASPSYGGTKVLLPDESLFTMLARYRASGVLPEIARRGWGVTEAKRAKLLDQIKTAVGPKVASELGDEELMRMAYAMVGGDEWDGTGRIHKALQSTIVGPWKWVHGTFTRSVLALQPIRWAIKVALIEEPVRGAMMEMPSIIINPKKAITEMAHAYNIARYESYATKFNDVIDSTVAKFANAADDVRAKMIEDIGAELDPSFADPALYRIELVKALKSNPSVVDEWVVRAGVADDVRTFKRAAKKVIKIEDQNIAAGLRPDFTWDDAPEIASKSLFSEYVTKMETTQPLAYNPNDPQAIGKFARAYAAEMVRIYNDPFFRIAATHSNPREAAVALRQHPAYPQYADAIRQIGEYRGLASDPVESYITHIRNYVNRLLGPFEPQQIPGLDAGDAFDIYRSAANAGQFDSAVGDASYTFNLANEKELARTITSVLQSNRSIAEFNAKVPSFIDSTFKETFESHGRNAQLFGRKGVYKRFTDFMLKNFGERATMNLNRRPAYLYTYKRQYELLTRMGMSDELARKAAHRKAFEKVNFVYFNQDHMTPLVKKLNNIIPFFGAQVEVLDTWFRKIPLATGWAHGPATLVRRVDRMFAGLVNSGLVEVNYEEGDESFGAPVARFQLSFAENGKNAHTPLGQALSGVGWNITEAALGGFVTVRNFLANEDIDIPDVLPDDGWLNIDFGNPIDVLSGDANRGIGAVNNLFVSPSPIVKAGISFLTRNLEIGAANDVVSVSSTTEIEGNREEFLVVNRDVIIKQVGATKYQQALEDRSIQLELDPEIAYEQPGTSLYDTFVKPWLYPMGFPEHEAYAWTEFVPSTLRYMFRGMGISHGSADPLNFWSTDDEGNLLLDNTITRVLLPTVQDRYLAASSVITAIQNNEARTGNLSRHAELSARMAELADLAVLAQEAKFTPDGKLVFNAGFGSRYEQEWNQVRDELNMLTHDILAKGFRDASSAIAVRGILGFFGPATPRFQSEQQQQVGMYWDARDNTQMLDEHGLPNLYAGFKQLGTSDTDTFNELWKSFLEDPSGKEAKNTLREQMPELWVHTFGKTYWGRAGVPAELETIDDFFGQIEDGTRQPFDPAVHLQRIARAHIAAEKEAAILERGGDNPWEAAQWILSNWYEYKSEITDKASEQYDFMDVYDDAIFDGAYDKYRETAFGDDPLVLQNYARQQLIDLQDQIDDLEELVPSIYDGENRAEMASTLATLSAGIRDIAVKVGQDFDTAGIQSERDQIVSWYFDNQVAGYYGALADLYTQLDAVDSDEQASRIYDQIRMVNDKYGQTVNYNGQLLPSVQDWRWSRNSPEEQSIQLQQWLVNPVHFLDANAISRIREEFPSLAQSLPGNAALYTTFINYSNASKGINALADMDPETGERLLTDSERREANARLESQLKMDLIAMGAGGIVDYMDKWPIERFGDAGLLPANLNVLAGRAAQLRLALAQNDTGSGTQKVVRNIIDPMYIEHRQMMSADPVYAEFFRTIGQNLYEGEIDDRTIFQRFVIGEWWYGS